MEPAIEVTPEILKDLGELAVPFEDKTPADVIRKLIAKHKKGLTGESGAVKTYPIVPSPDLTHTKVLDVKMNNRVLLKENWNSLMDRMIKNAAVKFEFSKLDELVLAKHVKGKKTDQGYRYFPDANLSVQGQDATNAWKTTANLLKALGYTAEITFAWYDNPKAANPGQVGKFVIPAAK
jgi:hypothetical protein